MLKLNWSKAIKLKFSQFKVGFTPGFGVKRDNFVKYLPVVVFPPAQKRGMVKFLGKGHFKRATTG